MSTVPVDESPGRRFDAVKTAALSALLDVDSVPVEKVLAGLADWAVKSAPEATVRPAAARTVASAPSVRRGRLTSRARRDMETDFLDRGDVSRDWMGLADLVSA